jgi:TRAP-type C4-dicarboxylate transport system substrate-binding protein
MITVLRHKIVPAIVAGAFAAGLAAGSANSATLIKIGHPLQPKSALQKWGEFFKEGIEKRSEAAANVKIYPASQLGAIPRMIEGVQLGTIEMATIPPGFFTGIDQRYSVLAAPGLFDDLRHGHAVLHDPEFKKVFWSIGESKGMKMIAMSCDAPTDYATTRPIRTLADFKGLKLRVFGSKFEIESLRRLGATGVPMPLSEVIPAIQQKVIDGNKAAIVVFVPFKYQTVAKYVFEARESLICINRVVSKVWFDKLPKATQTAIEEEAAKADDKIIDFSVNLVKTFYGVWTKTGGVLTRLNDAEHQELLKRFAGVAPAVLEGQPEVLEVYNTVKRVAARLRAK